MVDEFHTSEAAKVKVESDEPVKKKKKKHKNKDDKDRSSKKKASKASHSSSSAVRPTTDVDNVFDGDTLPKVFNIVRGIAKIALIFICLRVLKPYSFYSAGFKL